MFSTGYLLLFCLCCCLYGGSVQVLAAQAAQTTGSAPPLSTASGCLSCHQAKQLDENHAFSCSVCHGGNAAERADKDLAHSGLILQPSHPSHMQATCGTCHAAQMASASHSRHFTLENKINAIRAHFGAGQRLDGTVSIPVASSIKAITTEQALADDMLRRRCLRCHVYTKGDSYSAVRHGSGCAACHLSFTEGKLTGHKFRLPTDQQCLSCHYGNYVGSDYYGRYEHDLHHEYRTPYTTATETGLPPRPYAVEYHDLVADVHQQRGLACRDCHQRFVHGDESKTVQCQSCHDWASTGSKPALSNVAMLEGQLMLTGVESGKQHLVPQLRHPAHREYGERVDCQVCHAQWSFNDTSTHLLLTYNDDYEPWLWLTVQGSSEVEKRLEDGLYSYEPEGGPAMGDGISGEIRPGMWLKGFTERRWERMLIGRDASGRLRIMRPVLDLRLSMTTADGEAVFDNVRGQDDGLRPYAPHTIGPAGMFYRDRLQGLGGQ